MRIDTVQIHESGEATREDAHQALKWLVLWAVRLARGNAKSANSPSADSTAGYAGHEGENELAAPATIRNMLSDN